MNSSSTVPTTIRKKWNSNLSSEVPRSKLPSYKSSNLRSQKTPNSNTVSSKSGPKSSSSDAQSDQQSSLTKSSPSKQYKAEIAKLKKELTTMKTENSILKVKVRRVDDENIQKSKQIEKLRVELKAVQKVESANSKKSKESELLLLRQKCLRLEGALKEKDLALRRLDNETSLRVEGNGAKNQSKSSEGGDTDDSKQAKLKDTKCSGRPSSTALTSLSRSSQSIKTEVTKLREMIHKLENANQELQQQVKDKGEEIRRLKLHVRSQTYTKPPQTSILKSVPTFPKSVPTIPKSDPTIPKSVPTIPKSVPTIPKSVSTIPKSVPTIPKSVPTIPKSVPTIPKSVPTIPKSISKVNSCAKLETPVPNRLQNRKSVERQSSTKSNSSASSAKKVPVSQVKKAVATRSAAKVLPKEQNIPLKINGNALKSKKNGSVSNEVQKQALSTKQIYGGRSKLPITQNGATFVVTSPISLDPEAANAAESSIENKVQTMRENIAAKRIQRSWRDHQKRHLHKDEHSQENKGLEKAMTFIVTSLKHHKLRKSKLNLLSKCKNAKQTSPRLRVDRENAIVVAIQAATKNLWEKELAIKDSM